MSLLQIQRWFIHEGLAGGTCETLRSKCGLSLYSQLLEKTGALRNGDGHRDR